MRRLLLILTASITVFAAFAQSVGLVLSGGGAKGIAHIGVIQALEDNDIPIDYVAGTSMGAIVGGLYASGFTPEEMLELLLSKDFADWSTGVINENLVYYFDKKPPTPSMVKLNLVQDDSVKVKVDLLPSSLINPLPMNFAFLELFAPFTAQCGGNFDRLFVPYRCVASDVFNKRKVVLGSGGLGEAIRASMSFPIVFKPQYINGYPIFDGGIYDNFPVDVMRTTFAPEFVLGVDVSSGSSKIDMNSLVDQVETMIIQDENVEIPDSVGIKMVLNLSEFGLLDFPKARSIYKIGYDRTIAVMDSIKARVQRRMPRRSRMLAREVFKSRTPKVIFDSVSVSGAKTPRQNEFLKNLFIRSNHDTLNIEQSKIAYYRAITSGKLKDFVPHAEYKSSDNMFTLGLDAKVRDNTSIGVGGWLTSSTNSIMFMSLNYNTLSYQSFDGSLNGWVGQSYYAALMQARVAFNFNRPTELQLQAVTSKQKFYESDMLFYNDELPTFIINYDNFVRLNFGVAIGRKSKLSVGVGYGYLRDRFYQSNVVDFSDVSQDEASYKLWQARAVFERSSLNHDMYPTSGSFLRLTAIGVTGKSVYAPAEPAMAQSGYRTDETWIQGELQWDKYLNIHTYFSLGFRVDAVASTRKLAGNYTAMLVQSPAFMPTPATRNYFNPAFRSDSYIAGGVVPIWKIMDNLQFRSEFYAFIPSRQILEGADHAPYRGKWFDHVSYMGEASIIYNFNFASLSIYGNYLSYPAHNCNFGISFGLLFNAPRFLR